MAGDEDVTLGELGRRFDRFELNVSATLREMGTNFVPATLWQAEKRAMDREIVNLKAAADKAAEAKVHEHKEIHTRIDGLKGELIVKDEAIRKEKAQRYFAIGLAFLGAILGVIGTVVAATFRATNGG